jgi:hypothetical protein
MPDLFDQVAAPDVGGGDMFDRLTTATGDAITPDNYGRIAAARIEKARRKAQAAGADLNQNEQAAIMDAYRQVAGLPTLSNVDTFKLAQEHIAQHQSNVLNLARSTSAAFERQAVNIVAPAVDLIHPEWGKDTRRDIAVMNPYDPDRVSGKAGPAIAASPLLLAGGGVKAAAAIFGLQSATESLAASEDAGIIGPAKWGGAAGDAAITAGSILAGGKLAEWAIKTLAAKIPQFTKLLLAGDEATMRQVIVRETAQAGINLPTQGMAMLSGTIASNILARHTTDPERKWDDGLGETAFNVAAMTLTNHIVRAAEGVARARQGQPAEATTPEVPAPETPTPGPTPPEGWRPGVSFQETQRQRRSTPTEPGDEFKRLLERKPASAENAPVIADLVGRTPELEEIGKAVASSFAEGSEVNRRQIGEVDGKKIMLVNGDEVKVKYDMDFIEGGNGERQGYIPKDEIWVDANLKPDQIAPVVAHEAHEMALMAQGMKYEAAHKKANAVEKDVRTAQTASETVAPQEKPGLLTRLHRDEGGAVTPEQMLTTLGGPDIVAAGKQAVDTLTSAAADLQRTFAPGTRGKQAGQTTAAMRQENSRAARQADIRYKAYDEARRAFDVYARTNGQKAADDFMDAINEGRKQADPALQKIADTMDAERKAKVKDLQGLGVGMGDKFEENWFGRQWKNPEQAQRYFQSRRPLTGPKTFAKGRVLESVAEGREAGLELVTDNPVEMHIMKMGEMDKYIAGVRVIKTLEANGAAMRVQAGEAAPKGWERIHDQIGLYKAENPVTHQVEKGSFYAPEQVATLINNHLSPGLRGKAWFRTYLGSANMMNQFQLGMSGFHLGFTSGDAIVSKIALALRRTVNYGDLSGAVKDILGAPLAPVTNAMRGHKGLMEWFRPGTQGAEVGRIIGVLEDAGARVQSDPFYRTHVTDKMMKAFHQGNVLGGLGRALLLPVELPTRFIMDVVVPRQKLGVAMDLVRMEMQNNPDITHEALVAKARAIWDSADNRMGQLVYDNLFWNRLTKDIAMASVRSVGWNLGTFREVIGGAKDILHMPTDAIRRRPVELTNRAAYLLALPAVHMMAGAILNYVFTGEGPQNLEDYFFPRTGGVDEKGNPKRVSLPSYCKDLYHFGVEPLKTLANKVHPALTNIYDMLTNRDFYGVKIRNEDDPLMQQIKQVALFNLKSLEPLSSRNVRRGMALGEPPTKALQSLVGLTPAPARINETTAERLAADLVRAKIPAGARTQAEADKAATKRLLQQQLRSGDHKAFEAAIDTGKLSKTEAKAILKGSQQHPLESQMDHLDAVEALKVWTVATPQERELIRVPLIKKLRNLRGRIPAEEFAATVAKYREAGILK